MTTYFLNKYFTSLTKILILKKAFPTVKNIPLKHLLKKFENQSVKKIEKHFNTKKILFTNSIKTKQ